MYLAIIVLPLLGSIVSGFFGRKIGINGAQMLSTICVIITTILAIIVFIEVVMNNISVEILLCKWLDSELINTYWGFNFDSLTVSMLIPVLIISSLVHIYSVGYMSHDAHNQRFFSYLSLFTFMMVILVTANNFLLMFVGWEGVGVCSYLLVSFWFTRIAANQSSMSAFLTNRVGDCLLTLGMFIIIITFGNLDYSTVFSLAPFVSENSVTIIGICLLIGAMAKSSQIGLHVWLPLAMEGPTPVSALIHAATMVTAGVYLLMRSSPLIEYSSTILVTSLWIGSITTVFSSLIGLFQQDIKKVIAYSTMSQLGMMVIAIGLSSYNLALFHLINHAFYKGLLFLGAGAVIHAIADNQDFRKYGGFILLLPLSYTVMLIASLSLVAFPFMTGFYSKDFILESSFAQFTYSGVAIYITAVIGAIFTTLYSVKVLYLTFLTNANAPIINYNKAHEGNIYISLPLVVLALFSIFFGFLTKDIFIGVATNAFVDNSLFIHPIHENTLNTEFSVPHIFKLLPFILTIVIVISSLIVFEFFPSALLHLKFSRLGYNTFSFLNLRFLIEYVYNRFVAYSVLKAGGQTTKILDKGSVEKIGPYGLEKALMTLSRKLNKLDTGVVTSYALYILMGFILYLSIPFVFFKDQYLLFLVLYSSLLFVINSGKVTTLSSTIHKPNFMPESYNIKKNEAGTVIIIINIVFLIIYVKTGEQINTSYIPDNINPNISCDQLNSIFWKNYNLILDSKKIQEINRPYNLDQLAENLATDIDKYIFSPLGINDHVFTPLANSVSSAKDIALSTKDWIMDNKCIFILGSIIVTVAVIYSPLDPYVGVYNSLKNILDQYVGMYNNLINLLDQQNYIITHLDPYFWMWPRVDPRANHDLLDIQNDYQLIHIEPPIGPNGALEAGEFLFRHIYHVARGLNFRVLEWQWITHWRIGEFEPYRWDFFVDYHLGNFPQPDNLWHALIWPIIKDSPHFIFEHFVDRQMNIPIFTKAQINNLIGYNIDNILFDTMGLLANVGEWIVNALPGF